MDLSQAQGNFGTIAPQMALAPESIDAIAQRLRLVRIAYGRLQGRKDELEQTEFAQMCGISKQMWNNAERGRARLGLDSAKLIYKRTGADLQYIYYGQLGGLPHALAVEIERLQTQPRPSKRAAHRPNG